MGIKEKANLLKNLLYFEAIAKEGQISRAAVINGVKQSNMSNTLKELEEIRGRKLFNRIYNGVALTDAGRELFEMVCRIDETLNKIADTKEDVEKLKGTIKFWTSDGLATSYISHFLSNFYIHYPEVKLSIQCSLDTPKMADDFDLAIVYHKPDPKKFKILMTNTLRFGLFASADYLTRFGYPKDRDDVRKNFKIIERENYAYAWPEWKEFVSKSQVVATTNSSSMLMRLTQEGVGIALHPIGTARRTNNLVELNKIKFNLTHDFWLVAKRLTKEEKINKNKDVLEALTKYIIEATSKL